MTGYTITPGLVRAIIVQELRDLLDDALGRLPDNAHQITPDVLNELRRDLGLALGCSYRLEDELMREDDCQRMRNDIGPASWEGGR